MQECAKYRPGNLQKFTGWSVCNWKQMCFSLFHIEMNGSEIRSDCAFTLCLSMQILSQANQSQSQQHAPPSSASSSASQIPPPPSLPPPPGLSPAQFILHSSLPLVGCTKTPPSLLHPSIGGGCAQTPPSIMPVGLSGVTGSSGDTGWDNESKDPDKVKLKFMNGSGQFALLDKLRDTFIDPQWGNLVTSVIYVTYPITAAWLLIKTYSRSQYEENIHSVLIHTLTCYRRCNKYSTNWFSMWLRSKSKHGTNKAVLVLLKTEQQHRISTEPGRWHGRNFYARHYVFELSVPPIFVNAISQARLEGISSSLAQTSIWTQGWTD